MRLTRLRVAELRQFRQPFELPDLQPGLNVFVGPNEAGKSTLVRAIRAAFFERHRSTAVEDLRPYGDGAAAPTVELDFEIDGVAHRLTKSFLQRKRCELVVGAQRLDGAEAEEALAQRLGFGFAAKGASREEHWGIPGLLWIEQGAAHEVRDAVRHAADHLRQALEDSLGEVAASGGDELLAQLRAWRDELLTATGRPRAALQQAVDDEAEAQQRVASLQEALRGYRGQVDQLREARDAHEADARERPWQALRERQSAARQALEACEALAGQRQRLAEKLATLAGLKQLLGQRIDADAAQSAQLRQREQACAEAVQAHELAAAAVAHAGRAAQDAEAALARQQAALAQSGQAHERQRLAREAVDAQGRAAELAAALERASAEHARATALRREAASLRVAPADLAALREQAGQLRELQVREESAATRLQLDLRPGTAAELDGEPVAPQDQRLLVGSARLVIAGVGTVTVTPGGRDLAETARARAQLAQRHAQLLQRLGVPGAAEAEARELAGAQRAAQAQAAVALVQVLAPRGLEALQLELDQARARQAEAAAQLARLPAAADGTVEPVEVARQRHDAAALAAQRAAEARRAAEQAMAVAGSRLDAAQREQASLREAVQDPRRQAEVERARAELLQAQADETAGRATLAELDQRMAAARPDILRQDVERLRRSAEEAERVHGDRAIRIAQLEATLAATGSQGLEEQLAQAMAEQLRAQRRRDELQRRAQALELLVGRLEQRRQALTRRLQAPLQRHLDHYLGLLFPDGRVTVDEQLVPHSLSRPGPRGAQDDAVDTLSFGSREQMGIVCRLAYADLLREAGRPTLVILDDALVHSDEQRLAQMKRILFDAAQRHQVLLFSCHPGRWTDMGVAVRALRRG